MQGDGTGGGSERVFVGVTRMCIWKMEVSSRFTVQIYIYTQTERESSEQEHMFHFHPSCYCASSWGCWICLAAAACSV